MYSGKSHYFKWDYGPRAKFPLVQDKPVQFSLSSVFIVAKDLVYGRDSKVRLEPERLKLGGLINFLAYDKESYFEPICRVGLSFLLKRGRP